MSTTSPTGEAVLGTTWSLLSVSALMITARLYLRLKIKKLGFQASDTFICLSWLMSMTTACFDLKFYHAGALKEDYSFNFTGFKGPVDEKQYLQKLLWIANFPFYTTFYLTKMAFLTFYLALFPIFMNKLRFATWCVVGYSIVSWAVTLLVNVFACWPVQRIWSQIQAEKCGIKVAPTVFNICFALHLAGELMIFVLPFFMLRHIKMKPSVKVGVYATFAVGLIAIAFALTRFFSISLGPTIMSSRTIKSVNLIQLYRSLDMNVGLIVACMPSLRPYLAMLGGDSSTAASGDGSGTLKAGSMNLTIGQLDSRTQKSGRYAAVVTKTTHKNDTTSPITPTAADEPWDGSGSLRRGHGSDIELVSARV